MAREAPTVLVVDDDPAARRLVAIWLEERGFAVHDAHDGESGLREAARLNPDVVLLDWRLPDENGPSVCRRLAESVPRPAIVMLTGLDHPSDRDAPRRRRRLPHQGAGPGHARAAAPGPHRHGCALHARYVSARTASTTAISTAAASTTPSRTLNIEASWRSGSSALSHQGRLPSSSSIRGCRPSCRR